MNAKRVRMNASESANCCLWTAATHTARWEQKPIHEDSFAIIVRVVGEQTMPFILLLTTAITTTTTRRHFPTKHKRNFHGHDYFIDSHSKA